MNRTGLLSIAALCWWLLTGYAHGVTLVDLGLETPPPVPEMTVPENSPYYITNIAREPAPVDPADPPAEPVATDVTADVEVFRVGAGVTAHVGYGPDAVADAGITLKVANDMSVAGTLAIGKGTTQDKTGLPNAATDKAIAFTVGGNLLIDGGNVTATAGTAGGGGGGGGDPAVAAGVSMDVTGETRIANGSLGLRGADDAAQATLKTNNILIGRGGRLDLNSYAVAATTGTTKKAGEGEVEPPFYSVVVGNGGVMALNGGIRPVAAPVDPDDPAPPEAWEFRGLDVSAGGDGILVESGGVLSGGAAGGAIRGLAWPAPADPGAETTGQRLIVRSGGVLDASRGTIQVLDMGGVSLYGSYSAGYGAGGITRLEAADSRVEIHAGAELGLSRELQRHINSLPLPAIDSAGILRGGEIIFEPGQPPVLQSGLGTYTLALGNDADGAAMLYVGKAENGVLGDGTAADRKQFQDNMEALWHPGTMNDSQAAVMYDLAADATPGIIVSGEEGEFNRQVVEAFVGGKGRAVGEWGTADGGLYELYNGGAQFGPNAVAYDTASEVLAGMHRRVDFAGDEMARRDGAASALGLASYYAPEDYNSRVWAGGFGRSEEMELDYGIAGYEYKPSGFMAGYDRLYGDSLVVGVAGAYGGGDYRDMAAASSDSEITSYSVGAYVGYRRWTGFTASAYGSYSFLQNDLNDVRGGMRRRAEYDSQAWTVGGRLGYDLYPADGLRVTPTVGLERIHAVSREHDEQLNNLNVIRVNDATRDSTLLPLELALSFDLLRWDEALLRLNANMGYAYDFETDGMDGSMLYNGFSGAGPVTTAERELGRHRFNFGAGLRFSGTKLDVDARYNYYSRDSYKSHQFQGSLGVKF